MIRSDLFNEESICIFTDSSFKKYKNSDPKIAIGTTAPAYCIYHDNNCIEQGFNILHNSTSQQGELYAMLLGVMASYKYRNFPHIRLFSDNQNAVFSIREWIFNWVKETNSGKHTLGENGRISNQSYIMDIIYTIISNNIPLELYHVKGHVDVRKHTDIVRSRELFKRSNPFVGNFVDNDLIYQLALSNNTVDMYSTSMLKTFAYDPAYNISKLPSAITIGYAPFNMENYKSLVATPNN